MVIGWLRREDEDQDQVEGASSTWKRVERTQRDPEIPCLLAPQPAHAVLAGDLAAALIPKYFGELPPDIKQAILMHDTGWAMLDAGQIQRLRSASPQANQAVPVSFIDNSPAEAVGAWTASVNSVERFSPAGGFIVSRHFTLLATTTLPEHHRFVEQERLRQRRLETGGALPAGDLTKWVAALGFCDLLSLYLLTGLSDDARFPLAHPASPKAQSAPSVMLHFEQDCLRFTPRIFPSGAQVELEALKHPAPEHGARTEKLRWEFA